MQEVSVHPANDLRLRPCSGLALIKWLLNYLPHLFGFHAFLYRVNGRWILLEQKPSGPGHSPTKRVQQRIWNYRQSDHRCSGLYFWYSCRNRCPLEKVEAGSDYAFWSVKRSTRPLFSYQNAVSRFYLYMGSSRVKSNKPYRQAEVLFWLLTTLEGWFCRVVAAEVWPSPDGGWATSGPVSRQPTTPKVFQQCTVWAGNCKSEHYIG